MCTFHSVIVSRDGRIYHNPTNSHSSIAGEFGLENLPDQPQQYWECEWDGTGEMPANLVQQRNTSGPIGNGYSDRRGEAPDVAWRAAERHYMKLAAVICGELPVETAPFDQPEFIDVRQNVEYMRERAAQAERDRIAREEAARIKAEREAREDEARELADKILAPVESLTDSMDKDELTAFVRQVADRLEREIEDVFGDELAEQIEEAADVARDKGYEDGRERGHEDAAEDMYTSDYVHENIADFIDESEWVRIEDAAEDSTIQEMIAEARETAYRAGFAAALTGATPEPTFINGLPSFLFDGIANMVAPE